MAGAPAAHLLVGGVRGEACGVADGGRVHAVELPERPLGAPEAAEGEHRRLETVGVRTASGWSSTKCVGGTGISVSRPARARSGSTIAIFSGLRNRKTIAARSSRSVRRHCHPRGRSVTWRVATRYGPAHDASGDPVVHGQRRHAHPAVDRAPSGARARGAVGALSRQGRTRTPPSSAGSPSPPTSSPRTTRPRSSGATPTWSATPPPATSGPRRRSTICAGSSPPASTSWRPRSSRSCIPPFAPSGWVRQLDAACREGGTPASLRASIRASRTTSYRWW